MAREPLLNSDPTRVGRYRLSARLGSGGMGVVYLGAAEDGRQVAVKVVRPQLAQDQEFRKRFGREVAALVRVSGVCTVRVIEADTTSARPFLVTEYVDGPSLAEYIDGRGPLGSRMLYGLATGLAEALTAIHDAGIVHRDLKPSNVLLSGSGPKVIDFGIAQPLDATALTRPGVTIGSTGFVAPEQITGGRSGTAADIFAWGVTIAYAASGQPPFGTGTPESILYRVLRVAPDLITVPAELRPMVAAALAKEPGNRPTAHDLLDQLTKTSAQPSQATHTILAQNWRPPEPGPAAGAARPPAPSPAGGAPRPPAPAPAAGAVRPSASAPAGGAPRPPSPAPPARAARPPEPARAPDAFGPTAETVIPQAFRSADPPRPPQSWPPQPASGGTGPKRPGRRRVILGVLALCLAFALAAGGTVLGISLAGHHPKPGKGGTSPSATATSSATSALPVLTAGTYHGVKPKEIDFSADAGNVVTGITWSSWTATTAIGSGTSDIDSCVPSCAAAPTDLVATTLMLSDPVNGRFTVIREMRDSTTQAFVYPSTWALGAS
ncbi:MAG TPA: serine/threonine-protein kinase [Streptosporangiaceae bacterium]|nr:serine/threonine-protein kinase [Streptosporangiaceae bacterium]